MKFHFFGSDEILFSAEQLAKCMGVDLGLGEYNIELIKSDKPIVEIAMNGFNGTIRYQKICHFSRAFGLLVEKLQKDKQVQFKISEKPQFEMNGVMFDMCHGNGAFTVPYVKEVLNRIALMGLNTFMLYLEDNYQVDGQPRMGYMRPMYTKSMLKEIDDYAYALGIEMIPCVQVLAHLAGVLRWEDYLEYKDYDDCLLVGDARTEKFVEDVIKTNSEVFRSRRIHVGMDEAENIGRGHYIDRFGYENKVTVMNKHISLVTKICEKYGVKPMMWDDMFFKSMDDAHIEITAENIKKACPKNIQPVFWSYGCPEKTKFNSHVLLSPETIFAGGCWAWFSFGLEYSWTLKSTVYCLDNCKKAGVKEVFMTTWGDNIAEAPQPVNLVGAQMYAEIGYSEEFDEDKFKKRFKFCTGGNADDFKALERFDVTPVTNNDINRMDCNASKAFMYQDILTGLFDKNIEGHDLRAHYSQLLKDLKGADKRNGMFNSTFKLYQKAASFMELKADMGVRLTAAYKQKDIEGLKIISAELATLLKRTVALKEYYRTYWTTVYMPLGWDMLDIRLGGLENRIKTAKKTLDNYLAGNQDSIPELEVERMYFLDTPKMPSWCNIFYKIISPTYAR